MRKNNKLIYILMAMLFIAIGSCTEEELAKLKSDVGPNVLEEPSTDSYVLTMEDKDEVMETFEWTAPDYGFDAAVTYTLEFDRAGNDFDDPVEFASINNLLEADINVGEFNDLLLGAGF